MKNLILAIGLGFLLMGCGGGGGGEAQAQSPTINTSSVDVMTGMTFQEFTLSDTDGVQGVSCPIDRTAVSASCLCKIGDGAGPIFSVEKVGNGAVCGCDIGSGGAFAPLNVTVTCAQKIMTKALSSATMGKPTDGDDLPDEVTIEKWKGEILTREAFLHEARNRAR